MIDTIRFATNCELLEKNAKEFRSQMAVGNVGEENGSFLIQTNGRDIFYIAVIIFQLQ